MAEEDYGCGHIDRVMRIFLDALREGKIKTKAELARDYGVSSKTSGRDLKELDKITDEMFGVRFADFIRDPRGILDSAAADNNLPAGPAANDRLGRIMEIYMRREETLSEAELAKEFGVHERTVRRDMELLDAILNIKCADTLDHYITGTGEQIGQEQAEAEISREAESQPPFLRNRKTKTYHVNPGVYDRLSFAHMFILCGQILGCPVRQRKSPAGKKFSLADIFIPHASPTLKDRLDEELDEILDRGRERSLYIIILVLMKAIKRGETAEIWIGPDLQHHEEVTVKPLEIVLDIHLRLILIAEDRIIDLNDVIWAREGDWMERLHKKWMKMERIKEKEDMEEKEPARESSAEEKLKR